MSLNYLLDTSIFSQPIQDKPLAKVIEQWAKVGDASVATSAICLAEILQSLEERGSEKYWRRFRQLLQDRYQILPFDEEVAREFGKLSAILRRAGNPKPSMDLLIAATARRYGLTLATLNTKNFQGIPGLRFESWE